MKKYLIIVMSLLFLSWCNLIAPQKNADALTWSEATMSPYQSWRVNYDMFFSGIDQWYYESGVYTNSGFGLSFPSYPYFNQEWEGWFIVTSTGYWMKMRFIDRDGFIESAYFVQRFTKPADQSIEDAIFNVAQSSSMYPIMDNCVIKHETWSNLYSVELKDSFFSDIEEKLLKEYTSREQEILKQVEDEGENRPDLFRTREAIVNNRRRELCWGFAGVTSSSSKGVAVFRYDPQVSKTTFYYTPIFADRVPFNEMVILPDTTPNTK